MSEPTLIEKWQDEFWQESCQFYQIQSVKTLLLNLQDLDEMQVNRILFGLWFTQKFHQAINLDSVESLSQPLTEIEGSTDLIRAKRRALEEQWHKPYSFDQQSIRKQLLTEELGLEKKTQQTLVEHLCSQLIENKNLSDSSFEQLVLQNLAILSLETTNHNLSKIMALIDLWQQR